MGIHDNERLILINPSAAQLEHQNSLNGVEWRGALTQEAYMRREQYLPTQGIASEGGLKAWALVNADAKPEDQIVYAGCETLRKRALISNNGSVREVTAFGIASVFTPSQYRGKKYASRMIQELSKILPTLEEDCLFSVLYSDIGKTFYAREGWRPFPSSHISLPPEYSPHLLDTLESVVTPLEKKDLPALCKLDEQLISRKLSRHRNGGAVALIPDIKTMTWHHAREEFVANEILKRKPAMKGVTATVAGQRVAAIFYRMWYNEDLKQTKDNTLHIMRLIIEDEEAVVTNPGDVIAATAAILRIGQHEAHEWNIESVEIWNPSEIIMQAVQSVDSSSKVIDRDSDSIASLRWFGDPAVEDELVWMENEKFGWC